MLLFFSLFFLSCLNRVHKLTSHFLHRPAKYCRRAARPAKSVIFPKDILPFIGRLQAARFPHSDALHIFPQNTTRFVILCFFACKTQFPPGRSRLTSLSTNIICRIFSGICYFLRIFFEIFFIFFCELLHRKFSILFTAYTFECYIEI